MWWSFSLVLLICSCDSSNEGDKKDYSGKAVNHQAPMLAAQVTEGTLPPLKDRLPMNPLVIETANEIGDYGGVWRRSWRGIGYPFGGLLTASEPLLRWNKNCSDFVPNLAEKIEFLEKGRIWILTLRKGVKWSDGVSFTANDIVFTFNDVLMNKQLTPVYPKRFSAGGQPPKVEKIDDYTVKFTFIEPYGFFPFRLTAHGFPIYPGHYFKRFHPTYTPIADLEKKAKEQGINEWHKLFQLKEQYFWLVNPDRPTLWAWKLKVGVPASQIVWERNPYYWKTDQEGNQLPYIDKLTWDLVQTTEVLNFKCLSGELDFRAYWMTVQNYSLMKENEKLGNYRVCLWTDGYGSNPAFHINQTTTDLRKRTIFKDIRFRRALSLAINREELNELAFDGAGIPQQASMIRESHCYSKKWEKANSIFDLQRANELLDEIGMDKRGANGFRLHPDGKPFIVTLEWTDLFDNYLDIIPMIEEYWRAAGIHIVNKMHSRSFYLQRWKNNQCDITPWSQPGLSFMANTQFIFPGESSIGWAPDHGLWYRTNGKSGEKPTGDIARIMTINDELQRTLDAEKRNQLIKEAIELHIKNLWMIGTVGNLPQVVVVSNRLGNVPEKLIFATALGCPRVANPEQFYIKRTGRK